MAQKQETNGTWTYYGKYTDTKGNRVNYKKRGFKTKREAKEAERIFRLNLDNTSRPDHITFRQLADDYLNNHYTTQSKASSYQSNVYVFKRICESLGDTPLNKLTSKVLQDYISICDVLYSKQYVAKIYYCINKALRYAVMNNMIIANPMNKVYRDNRKNELDTKISFWEPEQFNAFIQRVDNTMYKAVFSFLYYTGARKGEMLALTWNDIDLSNKSVTLNKTVTFKAVNQPWMVTPPKTKNSIRTITMPDQLNDLMLIWKKTQSSYYGFDNNSFVFSLERPLPQETLRRTFKKYLSKTNAEIDTPIPDIRIHDLRHSHASYLINNMSDKFTDFDIAKRLGDTVSTLHETYAHWFKQADKSIVDMMNAQQRPEEPAEPQSNLNTYEELKQLKELLDLDIITQEEFQAKKKQLLKL